MKEKNPVKLRLQAWLDEALEDYFLQKNIPGPEDSFLVSYQEKNGQKHFMDYEKAYDDPNEYANLIEDDDERQRYLQQMTVQEPKPPFANIQYGPEEKVYLVDIDTLVWILVCLLYKEDIIELKVVKYYMAIRNMSGSELARKIGTTKQFIHGLLKAQYPIPRNKYEIISTALGFEMVEYFKKEEPFVFDETDL